MAIDRGGSNAGAGCGAEEEDCGMAGNYSRKRATNQSAGFTPALPVYPRPRGSPAAGEKARHCGEFNPECGAAFWAVLAGNFSALILHQPITDAQAEPGAFSHRLGGVKGVEHQIGVAHTAPCVGKKNDHVAFFKQRAHGQRTAAGFLHRIHGVVDDVGEHLKELIGVAPDLRQGVGVMKFDAHILAAQIDAAELHGAVDNRVDVQRHALLAGHLAREAEQAVDQALGAPRLFSNLFRQAPRPAVHRRIVGQQLGISEDGRQRVIDFMRRPSHQLAKRSQFFRLHELHLQPLQIVQRILRGAQQFQPLRVHQFLAQEGQKANGQNRAQRKHQPEGTHRLPAPGFASCTRKPINGSDSKRDSRQPGHPQGVPRGKFPGLHPGGAGDLRRFPPKRAGKPTCLQFRSSERKQKWAGCGG